TPTAARGRSASGMKGRPSGLRPGTATKHPPGSTRRESPAIDDTARGGSPITRFSGSAASSSLMAAPAMSPGTPRRGQRETGDGARLERVARGRDLAKDAALPGQAHLDPKRLEGFEGLAQGLGTEVGHPTRPVRLSGLRRAA